MRKKQIIYLIFLIVSAQLSGQVPPWDWVNALHTNMKEVGTDVVADPATGSVYLAGYWRGYLDSFIPGGGTPSTDFSDTYGGNDGLVAKYSPAGNLLWAFKIGGEGHDYIHAIHLDMDGNIYITGTASEGNIQFSGTGSLTPDSVYINTLGDDFFLAKYDSQGRLLWIRHSEGNSKTEGRGITSNSSGVYVTGSHKGTVSFGPLPLYTAAGDEDMFVVKYTNDGDEQWHISGSSNLEDYGEDITCDETHIYVTGEFEGSMLSLSNSAGEIMSVVTNTTEGQTDIFLASFTEDGNHQWTTTIIGSEDDYCLGITMDSDSLYLVGSIGDPALFPSFSGNPVNHVNDQDAFICAMSRLDGSTGWVITLADDSGGDEMARDISMDIAGNLFVTGYYEENIVTLYGSFDTKGDEDIFLASFTDDGKYRWIKTAGSTTADFGNGVSAAASEFVYLTGDYSGMTAFDSINVPNDVNTNIYLARLQLPCLEAVGGVLSTTNTVVCVADTVSLVLKNYYGDIEWQVSPPGMNSWSILTADPFDSIAFVPVVTADYRAYLNSGTCPPDSSNIINVQVLPFPSINISGGGDVCGLVQALQADPGINSGSWSIASGPGTVAFSPSPDSANVTVTATDYGTYEFKWTETNGICTGDSSVVVRFIQQPIIALIPEAKTCGLDYSLNVTTNTDETGMWSVLNGPGGATFLPDEQTTDALVQVDAYGVYTFQWTAINGICSSTAVTDVEFLEVPDVDAGIDMTIDFGDVVQLNGTGGDSVIWAPDYRLSDPTIPDPMADPQITTTYSLTVFSANGCAGTDTMVITVRPLDFANAGEDVSLCPGDSTQLSASGGDVYSWGPLGGLDRTDIPDPWAKPQTTTTYIVTVINADGITDSDTVSVIILPRPIVDAGEDQSICRGETAQLSATGVGDFNWNHPELLSNANIPDPVAMVDANTTFLVRITDGNGCHSFDDISIFVFEQPVADAGPDQEYTARFETSMAARLSHGETGTWSVIEGNGVFEDIQAPFTMVSDLTTGDNIFEWNVSNGICPAVSDRVRIRIRDFVIPTVITPNGDGKNDYFHVEGILEFPTSELIILNQWGGEVYHAAPYLNEWDGRDSSGRDLPEDTYFSVLKINSSDVRKGYVMIIR